MKHHCDKLPHLFSANIMPKLNIQQLGNKISCVSLELMYDYDIKTTKSTTDFQHNCIKYWNSLPMTIKSLPYMSTKEDLYKHLKTLAIGNK